MKLDWLKSYAPRSLMGRAALILLLPIVTIQLVVGVVFIQRHYENVTRQMTRNIMLDIAYVAGLVDDAPDETAARHAIAEPAGDLGLWFRFAEGPTGSGGTGTTCRGG
jgi:two-component system, OmpR family, osmolarity sensor histidine kinase EnvZ